MTYRDDLEAAHARIAALEAELADARRAKVEESPPSKAIVPQAPARKLGRIYFHRPGTLVPLLRLYVAAVKLAFARRPGMRPARNDNVLTWLFMNGIARPFVLGVWMPLYCAAMLVGLPILGAVYLVLSVLLLPIVVAGGFRFSPKPLHNPGWFHGGPVDESDAEGALFWLLFGPWVVLFLPAMVGEDAWPRR